MNVNGNQPRASFSSAYGTVFATAGVAIGLGNIWRFPYMMGKYGGVVFLLLYVLVIIAVGIPALMAEYALGRHTRRGPWEAFRIAGMPGGAWWSGLLLLTVLMASSYYGVVIGWVLYFAVAFGGRAFTLEVSTSFSSLTESFSTQFLFVIISVLLACASLYFGVKRGIEQLSKLALPLFFLLFAILAGRVLTLDGAIEGLGELLVPRWEHLTGTTTLVALGQAFFSLGLGGTFMVVYGSYMRSKQDIPITAAFTAGADLAAALMAGLIVVPGALAFAIPLDSGPSLMFEVMPQVFERMPAGSVFGAIFFLSVFLVAMLSLIAAYEVLVAGFHDALGWPRSRSLIVIALTVAVLGTPAMLSLKYVEYSDLIWGTTMQPLGGVLGVVALAWFVGRAKALDEMRRSSRFAVPDWLFYWIKWGIPSGILITLVYGWLGR